jgi:hypothetical protein
MSIVWLSTGFSWCKKGEFWFNKTPVLALGWCGRWRQSVAGAGLSFARVGRMIAEFG